MTRLRNLLAASAVLAAGALAPAMAEAAVRGFATGDVNLRAGPGTNYPVVTTLEAGDRVTIFGCVRGYSWCDVNWRGFRGWVSARYLDSYFDDRRVRLPSYAARIDIPIITFTLGDYFDRYYRDRPWYRDWRDARRDEREFRRERRDFVRDRADFRDEREELREEIDEADSRAERRAARRELRELREEFQDRRDEFRDEREEYREGRFDRDDRDRRRRDRDERYFR